MSFIDKTKLIDYLDEDIDFHLDDIDGGRYTMEKIAAYNQCCRIKRFVKMGVFDADPLHTRIWKWLTYGK